MFQKIGLIAKRDDARVEETCRALIAYLRAHRTACMVDADCAKVLYDEDLDAHQCDSMGTTCDLVIVVGGDGTLLRAARSLVDKDVRLLGINLGRLGFLTDVNRHEMEARLDEIFDGQFREEERFLLQAAVVREGQELMRSNALNDVVLQKWNVARLIQFDTFIDDSFVSTQRSDGLIVTTPTGSTAYALSGGGPIMHPALDAIALVPICPHTLSNRPIVVGAGSQVEIVVCNGQQMSAQLTCDGQTIMALEPGDRVRITRKPRPVRLIHPRDHDYFATLRTKLHWAKEL